MTRTAITDTKIAEQIISDDFDSAIVRRGASLYHRDQIRHITHSYGNPDDVIKAVVLGDSGKLYETSLFLSNDEIESFCSCPYEYQCKHGAAAAIWYYCEKQAPGKSPSQNSTAEKWLEQLNALSAKTSTPCPVLGGWQTFFLLTEEFEQHQIQVINRYMKKNGEWGRIKEMPSWNINATLERDYHTRNCLKLLEPANTNPYLSREHHTLEDEVGHLILKHALQSGRLLSEGTLATITPGPERTLNSHWNNTPQGKTLDFLFDDGSFVNIILTEPMMYKNGNIIGPISGNLNSEQYVLLSNIPPIAPEELSSVGIKMLDILGPDILTLPEKIEVTTIEGFKAKATFVGVELGANGTLPAVRISANYEQFEFPLSERALKQQIAKTGETQTSQIETRNNNTYRIIRDHEQELDALNSLRVHLGFMPYDANDSLSECWLPSETSAERHILKWHNNLPTLEAIIKDNNWLIEIHESYQEASAIAEISGEFHDADNGWFSMQLDINLGDMSFNTADIISRWLSQNTPNTLALKDDKGQWIIADMSAFTPIYATLMELYSDDQITTNIKLPPYRALAFDSIEHADLKHAPQLKSLAKKLRSFHGLREVSVPKNVKADLRNYQLNGLSWLMFLHTYQLGGILADDMGLGKTLQTLAFIQKLKSTRKLKKGVLIIAPTSLLWNWQAEAAKFTPSLSVGILHGSQRKMLYQDINSYDIVLTTYALAHRDKTILSQQNFDLLVLDEAQYIKNRDAKTAKAVRTIPADMRLCLTGTPLENHLGELWSLMDFALPGLLGHLDFFKRNFRTPIENQNNSERSQELAKRIAPFMLRRTKDKVATELPAKTEIEQVVHLDGDQKKLYESIRISMEKRVRELIAAKGMAKSHIEFLDALLKLRQACIAPQLVKLKQAKSVTNSAKLEWLHDSIPEMIAEGRKVLIFSQFTQMLTLVGEQLDKQGISFCKLTGQTKHRQKVVAEFQDGQYPVFLISLKAGGAGLNLTAADTVIHTDPWWNPAAENQATDRAHRIGQDKPIFVYKLIAQGTVEEKIQAMQKHKQSLADSLFDGAQKAGLPKSGEELLSLFQEE